MNSLSLRRFHGLLLAVIVSGSSTTGESASAFVAIDRLPVQKDLPDPLIMLDGRQVANARQWKEERRPELKALFAHYMYGEIPPKPAQPDFKSSVVDEKFLGGKATLKLVTISIPGSEVPKIDLLVVTPNAPRQPAPAFLAMNFCGNHAIHSDSRIPLAKSFLGNNCKGCTNNHATDAARGAQAADWPLEEIIS